MEKTELIKRSPELQPVTVPAFVVNEYNQLKLENIALKEQLRWRPVSEKPKEGQIVFTMIQTGWVVAQYLNGEFYVDDGFTFGDRISGVNNWLPIPPAPDTLPDE